MSTPVPPRSSDYVQSITDFFTRKSWVQKLVPLISAITLIYIIFMIAVLIGLANEPADSFVMLVGYTNLIQLIALPILRLSKLANPTLLILYLIFNGVSIAGLVIIFSLVLLPFGKIHFSSCSMEQLIIDMYALSLIAMEIVAFFQYRHLMKNQFETARVQLNVPLPANNKIKVDL